jgi:acyl transferase domain-containing protein
VIRAALESAKVAPGSVSYVETHGTGTPLGDPIEVNALSAVLAEGRDPAHPVALGSVKTVVGHLEAAAGVVGLIKTVVAIARHEIPPHLHLTTRNPHIDWASIPVVVPTSATIWTPIGGRRIAGVSSFGFSGTNAHVILEEPPSDGDAPDGDLRDRPLHVLGVSARDDGTLRTLATRFAAALGGPMHVARHTRTSRPAKCRRRRHAWRFCTRGRVRSISVWGANCTSGLPSTAPRSIGARICFSPCCHATCATWCSP